MEARKLGANVKLVTGPVNLPYLMELILYVQTGVECIHGNGYP